MTLKNNTQPCLSDGVVGERQPPFISPSKKLSERRIKLLREFVDFTCEDCHRTELSLSIDGVIKLQPHRIK